MGSYTGVESIQLLKLSRIPGRLQFWVIIEQEYNSPYCYHLPQSAASPASNTFVKCLSLYIGKESFRIAMITMVY